MLKIIIHNPGPSSGLSGGQTAGIVIGVIVIAGAIALAVTCIVIVVIRFKRIEDKHQGMMIHYSNASIRLYLLQC